MRLLDGKRRRKGHDKKRHGGRFFGGGFALPSVPPRVFPAPHSQPTGVIEGRSFLKPFSGCFSFSMIINDKAAATCCIYSCCSGFTSEKFRLLRIRRVLPLPVSAFRLLSSLPDEIPELLEYGLSLPEVFSRLRHSREHREYTQNSFYRLFQSRSDISWSFPFQSRLFQYAVQCSRCQFIARISRNRYPTRLHRVLELSMIGSLSSHHSPAVFFDHFYCFSHFHSHKPVTLF